MTTTDTIEPDPTYLPADKAFRQSGIFIQNQAPFHGINQLEA